MKTQLILYLYSEHASSVGQANCAIRGLGAYLSKKCI